MSNVGEFPLSSFLEDRTQKLEIRRRRVFALHKS